MHEGPGSNAAAYGLWMLMYGNNEDKVLSNPQDRFLVEHTSQNEGFFRIWSVLITSGEVDLKE